MLKRYQQARQNLELALQFQQQLLDRIPIPVFYKNEQGVYLGCNKSYEKFMGLERNAIVGHRVFDISPGTLARIYQEQDSRLLASPGEQIYECAVENPAQEKRHVIFHKATFEDPTGEVGGIVGGILDITELKQAEMESSLVIAELHKALDNVKLLSRLLPICASCKKIRDDKGYWNQLEAYLNRHANLTFTHGLCPDCGRKYFPGIGDTQPDNNAPQSGILFH
jgi:PAS domain S-box-containing protein